jgi:hypothetical protein
VARRAPLIFGLVLCLSLTEPVHAQTDTAQSVIRRLLETGQTYSSVTQLTPERRIERAIVHTPVRASSEPGVCERDTLTVEAMSDAGAPSAITGVLSEREYFLYAVQPRSEAANLADRERRCAAFPRDEVFGRAILADGAWLAWVAGQVVEALRREARGPDAGPLAAACSGAPRACPSAAMLGKLLRFEQIGSATRGEVAGHDDQFQLSIYLSDDQYREAWLLVADLRRDADDPSRAPRILTVRFRRQAIIGEL